MSLNNIFCILLLSTNGAYLLPLAMTLLDPFYAALCFEITRSSVNPLLNAVLDGLQLPFHFEPPQARRVKSEMPDLS